MLNYSCLQCVGTGKVPAIRDYKKCSVCHGEGTVTEKFITEEYCHPITGKPFWTSLEDYESNYEAFHGCPPEVTGKPFAQFNCEFTFDGKVFSVTVDDEGFEVNISVYGNNKHVEFLDLICLDGVYNKHTRRV